MSSSSFAPLLGGADRSRAFRALAEPEPAAATPVSSEAPAEPVASEPSEEVRRAFQAGYALGRDELRADVESIGESFALSLQELGDFRARLKERYERELLELALGVARKVVQQELAERPEIWLGMIRSAVKRAVDRERITVRVPADLLGFLRQSLPELRASLEHVKELELVEDPTLARGACVIESRFGDIDIGVDTQIDAARRALVEAEG
jgi:flagellar assembly protein FliH